MRKIKIHLSSKTYPVLIGNSIFPNILNEIKDQDLHENIFIVVDGNVMKFYGKEIKKVFSSYKEKLFFYTLKPGEKSKSSEELHKIYKSLLDNKFGRDSLVVAIGGGVTGDLAGYAASTFLRGVQLVHVPTTIISDVDSSIGGKTGINFNTRKNMIGSFYQPDFVLIDTSFLDTLSLREMKSGIGEIIKYAFLSDLNLYNYIKDNIGKIFSRGEKVLERIITQSVILKGSVVSQDEKEKSLRKILNLGHTFGHAYESVFNFRIMHGEAVIAGIITSLFLSNRIGILSKSRLLEFLDLPLKIKLSVPFTGLNKEKIFKIMQSDKKVRGGKIKFVLVSDIGNILLDVEAGKKDIFYALQKTEEILSAKK
jgi:3-dehydroquinate synthase